MRLYTFTFVAIAALFASAPAFAQGSTRNNRSIPCKLMTDPGNLSEVVCSGGQDQGTGMYSVGTAGATLSNPDAGITPPPPPGQPSVPPGYTETSRTTTQTGDSAQFNLSVKLSVPGVAEVNLGGTFTFPGDTHSVTYVPTTSGQADAGSSSGGDTHRGASVPLDQCVAP